MHIVSSNHQLHTLITSKFNNFQEDTFYSLNSQPNELKIIIEVEKEQSKHTTQTSKFQNYRILTFFHLVDQSKCRYRPVECCS